MYDIESLYEATSVADACRALAEDPQAMVVAGGTDVLVKVRAGKFAGAHLVSIHELHDELDGVTLAPDGTVEIGPITWFHHVTTSPVARECVLTLADACDTPGGPQLRVSGTSSAVSWSIGNSNVATIDASGVVRGVHAGTTTAYAKVDGKVLECIVRIK